MSYPAAVKDTRIIKIETENISSFQEKRTPFFIKSFKRRKIHNGWIGFYLSEIRIDRKIDGKIARQSYLCINPCIPKPGSAFVCKRVIRFTFKSFKFSDHIRHYFNTA